MSEAQSTDSTTEAPAQDAANEAAEAKVDEIDWKAKAREWESRAKANKSAADELAQIKDAQRTDAERAAAALEQAKADAAAAQAELLRYQIAAKHGITDAEDIALFLTGTDEDTLTKQATRLASRASDDGRPRSPRPDPNQGRTGSSTATTADQFAGVVGGLLN